MHGECDLRLERDGALELVEIQISSRIVGTVLLRSAPECPRVLVATAPLLDALLVRYERRGTRLRVRLAGGPQMELRGAVVDDILWSDVDSLGALMRVVFVYDRASAALRILDGDSLPIARRLDRSAQARSRIAQTQAQRARTTPLAEASHSVAFARAAIIDYCLHTALHLDDGPRALDSTRVRAPARYRSEAGGALGVAVPLGGGILRSVLTHHDHGATSAFPSWQLTRAPNLAPDPMRASRNRSTLGFTDLMVGSTVAVAGEPYPLVGLSISNHALAAAPLTVSGLFEFTIPPGWMTEITTNGGAIPWREASTGHAVAIVAQSPGTNIIEIVQTSPDGDVRRRSVTFSRPPTMLPGGGVEYSAAVGRCVGQRDDGISDSTAINRPVCNLAAGLEVGTGVTRALTVRGGLRGMYVGRTPSIASEPFRIQPSLSLVTTPTRSLYAESRFEGANPRIRNFAWRSSLRFVPSSTFDVGFTHDRLASPLRDGAEARVGVARFSTGTVRWQLPVFARRATVHAFAHQIRQPTLDALDARLAVGVMGHAGSIEPYLETTRRSVPHGIAHSRGDDPQLGMRVIRSIPLHRYGLRAASVSTDMIAASSARLRQLGVDLTSARWQISVMASRTEITAPVRWWLTFSPHGLPTRLSTTVAGGTGGASHATHRMQGIIVADAERRRLRPSDDLASTSGVMGRVFFDRNANGHRDAGEPGVAGVRVLLMNRAIVTNADGTFAVPGLAAWTPIAASIDTLSLPSPALVPTYNRRELELTRGAMHTMDVPIVVASTLVGRLAADADIHLESIEIAALQLVNEVTGDTRDVEVFSDRTFLADGVAPGRYRFVIRARDVAGTPLALASESTRLSISAQRTEAPNPDLVTAATRNLTLRLRKDDRSPRR